MRYWCSFFSDDPSKWEYRGPWWMSGERVGRVCIQTAICAAVVADDEEHAKRIINDAHDPGHVAAEWRFVDARPDDWDPFGDRFVRKAWMQWPWPEAPAPVAAEQGGKA